jgi:hypothetical protein
MGQKYSTAIIFGPKLSLSEQLLSRALVFGVKSLTKKAIFLTIFLSAVFFCAKLLLNFETIAVWSQTNSEHLFLVPKLKQQLYFRQYTIPSFVHHSAKIPPYHS